MIPSDFSSQDRYHAMIGYLSAGGRLPPATIRGVLTAAGKTADALVLAVLCDATGGGPAPGDPCPAGCPGRIVVRRSWRAGGFQTQRLHCPVCKAVAGTRRVPAGIIRRRARPRQVQG